MIAYKIFKKRKDGSLGSLFIDRRRKLAVGVWLEARKKPTKGYAVRCGWHALLKPEAPHLKLRKNRVWMKVKIIDFELIERPKEQGGTWAIAQKMKILKPHTG